VNGYEAMALRIAQYCLSIDKISGTRKARAGVILDTLRNRVAVQLAERRGFLQESFEDGLPTPLLLEWKQREKDSLIYMANGESLISNRFQKKFWHSVNYSNFISLSAPTSSGKSFIVTKWLINQIQRGSEQLFIYLVPTRALVQQVSDDIDAEIPESLREHVNIAVLPIQSAIKKNSTNIFVFTQERLHLFLNITGVERAIDILIVDEAQKIGDGQRGILLQQVSEQCVEMGAKKIIFASPFTENPEVLIDDLNG
jgi:hypothetical protein